jgi:hypothetical protein
VGGRSDDDLFARPKNFEAKKFAIESHMPSNDPLMDQSWTHEPARVRTRKLSLIGAA